jgi:hypothetical protein
MAKLGERQHARMCLLAGSKRPASFRPASMSLATSSIH